MFSCRTIALALALLPVSLIFSASAEGQETTASGKAQEAGAPSAPSPTPSATASPDAPADSTKLEVIKAPKPIYPDQAEAKELQGQVRIKLLISETGDVENTEIESGNPILAKAAADAMKNWKFKPYIKNGRAVKVRITMPFDFAFRNKISDERSKPAAQPGPAQMSGGPDPSNPAKEDGNRPQKLRVAQGVMDGHMVHRVEPVYPPEARRNRITGTVILQATIGTDGRIHNLKAISGPKELVEASIGAVEQWRYAPYLLEGKPVEVETTVKIQFHM